MQRRRVVESGGGIFLVRPCARTLTGVCKRGIVAISRPLPVIPSAARNLKSMTVRPDIQCLVYIMTKSENSVGTLYVGLTLGRAL